MNDEKFFIEKIQKLKILLKQDLKNMSKGYLPSFLRTHNDELSDYALILQNKEGKIEGIYTITDSSIKSINQLVGDLRLIKQNEMHEICNKFIHNEIQKLITQDTTLKGEAIWTIFKNIILENSFFMKIMYQDTLLNSIGQEEFIEMSKKYVKFAEPIKGSEMSCGLLKVFLYYSIVCTANDHDILRQLCVTENTQSSINKFMTTNISNLSKHIRQENINFQDLHKCCNKHLGIKDIPKSLKIIGFIKRLHEFKILSKKDFENLALDNIKDHALIHNLGNEIEIIYDHKAIIGVQYTITKSLLLDRGDLFRLIPQDKMLKICTKYLDEQINDIATSSNNHQPMNKDKVIENIDKFILENLKIIVAPLLTSVKEVLFKPEMNISNVWHNKFKEHINKNKENLNQIILSQDLIINSFFTSLFKQFCDQNEMSINKDNYEVCIKDFITHFNDINPSIRSYLDWLMENENITTFVFPQEKNHQVNNLSSKELGDSNVSTMTDLSVNNKTFESDVKEELAGLSLENTD